MVLPVTYKSYCLQWWEIKTADRVVMSILLAVIVLFLLDLVFEVTRATRLKRAPVALVIKNNNFLIALSKPDMLNYSFRPVENLLVAAMERFSFSLQIFSLWAVHRYRSVLRKLPAIPVGPDYTQSSRIVPVGLGRVVHFPWPIVDRGTRLWPELSWHKKSRLPKAFHWNIVWIIS